MFPGMKQKIFVFPTMQTLLSFSGYNEVLTVQAFMWEILYEALPMPIFLGLKKDIRVSFLRDTIKLSAL